MFDEYARQLIEQLPSLPKLDHVECRRLLSRAYLLIVEERITPGPTGEQPETNASDGHELRGHLQRMANALESVAVFDSLNGLEVPPNTRQASAFVAAEALALLAELAHHEEDSAIIDDPILDGSTYAKLESGLLYMIGGYDVNAVAATASLRVFKANEGPGLAAARQRAGIRLCNRVVALCRGDIHPIAPLAGSVAAEVPFFLDDLAEDTRLRLYGTLSDAIDAYLKWLGGSGDLSEVRSMVEKVRKACCLPSEGATAFPRRLLFSDNHRFHEQALRLAQCPSAG
jgi:hypothetical protein